MNCLCGDGAPPIEVLYVEEMFLCAYVSKWRWGIYKRNPLGLKQSVYVPMCLCEDGASPIEALSIEAMSLCAGVPMWRWGIYNRNSFKV